MRDNSLNGSSGIRCIRDNTTWLLHSRNTTSVIADMVFVTRRSRSHLQRMSTGLHSSCCVRNILHRRSSPLNCMQCTGAECFSGCNRNSSRWFCRHQSGTEVLRWCCEYDNEAALMRQVSSIRENS